MPKNNISRHDFINISASLGALAVFGPPPSAWARNRRQRVAVVGTGTRSTNFFIKKMQESHCDFVDIVGFCDRNRGRLSLAQRQSKERTGLDIPAYIHTDFDKMMVEQKPDVVLVTTMDSTHYSYIIRAMELGCDVITEKPMTVDAEKCQAIIDAQYKTGKSVTVTFNYRYSPSRRQIKDILSRGDIGDILSVDFNWMLNTHHGADYFRRWHSKKEFSGGLMVHKATHHFDLMNWWLSAIPATVYAQGKREYYTPKMAKCMGLSGYHERCRTCPESDKCGFFLDLAANKNLKELYLDNEKYDGYQRDKCVFRPDIDIEDNMSVVMGYDNGINMSYSLNAFNSWEGYTIAFNGTEGRLEHKMVERVYISGDGGEQGGLVAGGSSTVVIPLRWPEVVHEVWAGKGGHGGGDDVLLNDLFDPHVAENVAEDEYLTAANQRAGAYSILTGIAANESMRTGKLVYVSDLAKNIGYPDYSLGPSRTASVAMPKHRDSG